MLISNGEPCGKLTILNDSQGQANNMLYSVRPAFYVNSVPFFLLFWSWIFWDGLKSAGDIWFISEIFNHCFFVLPGAFYLIYRKKSEICGLKWHPNFFVLPLLIGCFLLYGVGIAGSIQLFMHLATFAILPISIWFIVGNQVAAKLAYPLFFFLFAIPIGEELVPLLQQITADLSVFLLKLTGVPVYRTGLYLEIPNGKFLVAEACSGISFFIASIVIGTLYAHLNITAIGRKLGFVFLSFLFPIIANALRVYGIILTGYLTDMKHAVGADHLIYGGVFFSFVIICLIALGEFFRDKKNNLQQQTNAPNEAVNVSILPASIACITALGAVYWYSLMSSNVVSAETRRSLSLDSAYLIQPAFAARWEPSFVDPTDSFLGSVEGVDTYIAWYQVGYSRGELISSLNSFYHQDDWTIVSSRRIEFAQQESMPSLTFERISSPVGTNRLLTYWYVVDDRVFSNELHAKLYQLQLTLLGQIAHGGVVAVSMQVDAAKKQESEQLFALKVSSLFSELNKVFPNG